MLCVSGVKFTESFIKTREDFLKLLNDDLLEFNQVPMLEIDGKHLVQTNAILRYLAEKNNMTPATPDLHYRANTLFEASRDLQAAFMPIGFKDEGVIVSGIKQNVLPQKLPTIEKQLVGNSSGYLAGDAMSIADVGMLEFFLLCLEYCGQDVFESFPNIQKYVNHMKSLEKVQYYLSSVRQRANDKEYINEVQTSLGRVIAH